MTDRVGVDGSILVDTAALALHLRCTPGQVRRMVQSGYITAVGKTRTANKGRPSLLFDLEAVDAQLAARRAELDQGQRSVRK